MTRRLPLALLLLVPLVALAEKPEPTVKDPLPFDHAEHAETFRETGVRCVDCHPVGARSPEGVQGTEASVPAPRSTCHGCHRRAVKGAPRGAPSACAACHPVREELLPGSHDLDWLADHGDAARGISTGCADCHETDQCVECHEARGAKSRSPHGPGFRSSHGIEARMDPASCSSCHSGSTCTSCHTSGGIPL